MNAAQVAARLLGERHFAFQDEHTGLTVLHCVHCAGLADPFHECGCLSNATQPLFRNVYGVRRRAQGHKKHGRKR